MAEVLIRMRAVKKKSLKKGIAGFTLVEILVSTAILAIAVTGILISFLKSMELAEVSRNSSLAIQAARGRMEQMRSTLIIIMIQALDPGGSLLCWEERLRSFTGRLVNLTVPPVNRLPVTAGTLFMITVPWSGNRRRISRV